MIYEKRRPVHYVTLNNALYGCLRLALLLYACLVSYMKGKGFEINSYYPCMENTMISGKKMTVFWNVDDLKWSHVVPKEVTNFMD